MEEVPFDDRHVPRAEIDWDRSAWWWYPLTRALHPAIKMLALVTSLVAIWVAKTGIWLGEWLFDPAWTPNSALTIAAPFSPLDSSWAGQIGRVFQSMFSFSLFGLRELAFVTFVALWLAAVFSIFGGIIARRGLVELGQRTIAPWGESLRIVVGRWHSYLWATGMHLVGIGVMLAPVLLLGWLSTWGDVGANVAGVLLLICFPIIFGVGRFGLSMLLGFPLSVCAIAAEKKADAFEGFSRSNAYFFQRPFVACVCVLLLLLVGSVGSLILTWTLYLGWGIVRGTYFFSGGALQSASEPYVSTGNWLVVELLQAYWFSFFWTASAATYLILRKSVDFTELDQLDGLTDPVESSLPTIPESASETTSKNPNDDNGESAPDTPNSPDTNPGSTEDRQ